jgi:hypothetical protein
MIHTYINSHTEMVKGNIYLNTPPSSFPKQAFILEKNGIVLFS